MLVLPFVPSKGEDSFDTFIEDVTYTFDVHWNEYEKAFYLNVSVADGVVVAVGLKITVGSYIGRYSTHPLFRRGVLAAIDTEGTYRDPTFDDLGTRVEVRYYTVDDLVAEMYAVAT